MEVAEEVNGIRLGYARVGNAVVVVVVVGMLCGERSQQRLRCAESLKDFKERGSKSAQGRKGGGMEKRKVMRERLLVEVWVRVLRAPAVAG